MHVHPLFLYIAASAIVGWLGDRSRFGFWGSFLGSLLLTPMLTMAVLLFVARGDEAPASSEA